MVMRSATALIGTALLTGCASSGTMTESKAQQGAILGALAGAAAGAAIGGHEHRAEGVLVGAAAGAIAGGLVGRYLDEQARELDAIPDAQVRRRDDSLLVQFSDSILFEMSRSSLHPGAYERLRALARTLNGYPHSRVIVRGHTDSAGSEGFNQQLSEERSDRVRNFLIAEGVAPARITAIGFGEQMPIATNATPEGRAQNRRVEIEIRPDRDVLQGD